MIPDITIFCLTYNHIKYIKDTFEGFLKQKTNYIYKIFVYDDASTDGTSDIVREYALKYPELFDAYVASENLYQHSTQEEYARQMRILYSEHIQGEYIAWCEGDDYWTAPDKLQMQIEYMENHPECSMSAHASLWIDYQKKEKREYHPFNKDRYLTDNEIILQPTGNLSTASLVMRKDVLMKEDNFPLCDVGDVPIQLSALYRGKIYYFDRVMSVYRYMHDNSWSAVTDTDYYKTMLHSYYMLEFYQKYDGFTEKKYHSLIREKCICYMDNILYIDANIDQDEYENISQKVNKKTKEEYTDIIHNHCIVRKLMKEQEISDDVLCRLKQFNKIVIMGIGKYSHYIKNAMDKYNIEYTGFVVTKLQGSIFDMTEKLWQLDRYPYKKDETIVVVAISQRSEQSVLEALKKHGFTNYITPLWTY